MPGWRQNYKTPKSRVVLGVTTWLLRQLFRLCAAYCFQQVFSFAWFESLEPFVKPCMDCCFVSGGFLRQAQPLVAKRLRHGLDSLRFPRRCIEYTTPKTHCFWCCAWYRFAR